MIEGKCPVCRRVFKVEDRYAGMTGRCKTCGAEIHVPGQLDEGLDGLRPPPSPAPQAPSPSPTPSEHPQDTAGGHYATQPPSAVSGEKSHPADDLARPHDARARYEPPHGPTTLEGSWLKDEGPRQPHQAEPPPAAPEPLAPTPAPAPAPQKPTEALAGKLITPPVPEPSPTQHRPVLVTIACPVLAALAVAFAVHFASAGAAGIVAACLGLLLAAVAVARLWTAQRDGLLAALLFCLCVAGSAFIPSRTPLASHILLGASALALALLLAGILRRSGRDYFTT